MVAAAGTAWGFAGLVTPLILGFLGWFFFAGIVGYSGQLQLLLLVGIGIWLLLKRK